jgi:hypothetical protein
MAIPEPAHKQFTTEELNVIYDALIFTLNCLDRDREQGQLYNNMEFVLTKVASLLKQVETTI